MPSQSEFDLFTLAEAVKAHPQGESFVALAEFFGLEKSQFWSLLAKARRRGLLTLADTRRPRGANSQSKGFPKGAPEGRRPKAATSKDKVRCCLKCRRDFLSKDGIFFLCPADRIGSDAGVFDSPMSIRR